MLVSVIIPCYNYARFLPEAVHSVLAQSYSNWECLIINDGSPDNTGEVALALAKSDSRIHYHYKTNGGLSSARNYGIEAARGELICFLDADDLFDKDKLREQVKEFLNTPAADIVYGKAMFFEKNNPDELYANKSKTSEQELADFSGSGSTLISVLVKKNLTVVSAPLVKKEVFKTAGCFDPGYKSYEDWQFWLRCALAGCSFVYCNQPAVCTYIRFGHESMMSDKKKLVLAGIRLRKFLQQRLPLRFQAYNLYRLTRSYLKLLTLK